MKKYYRSQCRQEVPQNGHRDCAKTVAATGASQQGDVAIIDWMDALAESSAGIYLAGVNYKGDDGAFPPGFNEVLEALYEAKRLTESASIVRMSDRPS